MCGKLGLGVQGDALGGHVLHPGALLARVHDLLLKLLDQQVGDLEGEDDVHVEFLQNPRGEGAGLFKARKW